MGDGILGAGMDTIPVGPRSATRREVVHQTRTDHVTGMGNFPVSIVICLTTAEMFVTRCSIHLFRLLSSYVSRKMLNVYCLKCSTFRSFAVTTTVTDTTIHIATGLPITLLTIPEHTTDPRITVAPTTNTRDLPTRGARITTPDPTRKVEIGETTITEVALGIICLKIGTTRTAIGTAIRPLVMEIRRARPSRALQTIAKDMEKRNEASRLIGRKDDSF